MSEAVARLLLVHWHAEEAETLAAPLRRTGWQVEIETEDGGRAVRRILADPPRAVAISLGRLPSHGRETARALRESPGGKDLSILFFDGDPAKVEAIRQAVAGAQFLSAAELPAALDRLWKG